MNSQDPEQEEEEEELLQDYLYLLNHYKGSFKVDRSKESVPIEESEYQKQGLSKSLSALLCILSEERRGIRYFNRFIIE